MDLRIEALESSQRQENRNWKNTWIRGSWGE